MAIFGTKDEKQARQYNKAMAHMRKHRLDSLGPEYAEDCMSIFNELAGIDLMEGGVKMTIGANAADKVNMSFLHAIMEQNWIIIKQLDRISKQLEK